jgi:chaperonin GroEL (HSP60 family)
VDAALLVEFVDAQLHAVARLLAEARQRARQVLDGADADLVLAHALLLREQASRTPAPRPARPGWT